MMSGRSGIRLQACYLFLVAVLVVGITQWSFLPVLTQTPAVAGTCFLDSSSWHTSKFAAPYKFFGGDSSQLFVIEEGMGAPEVAYGLFFHPAATPVLQSAQFPSERQPRSPPSL